MSFNESLELLEKLKDSLQKSIAIADEENKTKLMELTQVQDGIRHINCSVLLQYSWDSKQVIQYF